MANTNNPHAGAPSAGYPRKPNIPADVLERFTLLRNAGAYGELILLECRDPKSRAVRFAICVNVASPDEDDEHNRQLRLVPVGEIIPAADPFNVFAPPEPMVYLGDDVMGEEPVSLAC